jgi:ketosteroid isomerase-like protein
MTSKGSSSQTKREGHVLSVFRKSPSGKWLLARDANLIPAKQD